MAGKLLLIAGHHSLEYDCAVRLMKAHMSILQLDDQGCLVLRQ